MISTWKVKLATAVSLAILSTACGADGENVESERGMPLTDALPNDCTPLYPPDFTAIYLTTVKPKCAIQACHSTETRAAGLGFASADVTYQHWMDGGRIVAGSPGYSTLIARLQHPDKGLRMPPGEGLGETEICAITQWVYSGARR